MKKAPIPSQQYLNMLLSYDGSTGKLYWKPRSLSSFKSEAAGKTWNKRFANKEAFTALRSDGYLGGAIDYVNYLAHRIIFKMVHGYDPDQIDHDDRDRSNNKLKNLLDASATTNSRNSKLYSNNTSGVVGVHWDKTRQKWMASIVVNHQNIFLGRYADKIDAIAARAAAEIQYNFHVNHGK